MAVNPIVSSVDPITFEILSHRVYQISKEMGSTLERVGGTVNTTQMHDYMASLYLANGDVLSAGDSMGWHVACAGFAVTLQRGTEWAATGKVTQKIPADFPTAEKTSVRAP